MVRLIDANALLDKVQFRLPIDNMNAEIISGCVNITRRLIENAPTVEAVEVVRCKDCKHYCSFYNECDEEHNHYTEEGFREVYDNDFCSYGERRTNE